MTIPRALIMIENRGVQRLSPALRNLGSYKEDQDKSKIKRMDYFGSPVAGEEWISGKNK